MSSILNKARACHFPSLIVAWVGTLLLFYVFYFGPYFEYKVTSASAHTPPNIPLRAVSAVSKVKESEEWWKWAPGAHPPGRPEAPFPHGPWDSQFIEHITINDDFTLAIGADKTLHYMESGITDVMRWSERAMKFQREWLMRIVDFRHFMMKAGIDNTRFNGIKPITLVPSLEKYSSPFFDAYVHNKLLFPESNQFQRTANNVVDHALVVPITTERYDEAWVTLESIMQQVTFPKEIVIILFKARGFFAGETFSMLSVLHDIYAQQLPDGCSLKVYVSPTAHCPGDTRWFAFNQTTASVVTFFDGDDYLHPQAIQMLSHSFRERPELHFALAQYKGGKLEGPFNYRMYYDEIQRVLTTTILTPELMELMLSYSNEEYRKLENMLPTFNKTWWLGNTDAEPNWFGEEQRWWDGGCHNGWGTLRRVVMKYAPPPTKKFGGEDAIFNFRIAKSGFNYHCLPLPIGMYVKCFCDGERYLWKDEPEPINADGDTVSLEHLEKLSHVVDEAIQQKNEDK